MFLLDFESIVGSVAEASFPAFSRTCTKLPMDLIASCSLELAGGGGAFYGLPCLPPTLE